MGGKVLVSTQESGSSSGHCAACHWRIILSGFRASRAWSRCTWFGSCQIRGEASQGAGPSLDMCFLGPRRCNPKLVADHSRDTMTCLSQERLAIAFDFLTSARQLFAGAHSASHRHPPAGLQFAGEQGEGFQLQHTVFKPATRLFRELACYGRSQRRRLGGSKSWGSASFLARLSLTSHFGGA